MNPTRLTFLAIAALWLLPTLAEARITRIVITHVESPTFEGASFGATGQYEKIVGRAYGAVDPLDSRNAGITDIELAPRNPDGLVEYDMDFFILKPRDMSRGNRTIFWEAPNRGTKRAIELFNRAPETFDPTTAAHAGDGFLMRQGYTIVWSAWQGDVLPLSDPRLGSLMTMRVPVATLLGGDITGQVYAQYIANNPQPTLPLSFGNFGFFSHSSYETVTRDTTQVRLTRRPNNSAAPQAIPSTDFAFATNCNNVAATASTTNICLKAPGFSPDQIYELTYTAKNPLVLGLGFAATRDMMEFFKHADADDEGTQNPLRGAQKALLTGYSQSGRFARSFLQLGFNEGENGRMVFEGVFPQIASARLPLNIRFGQPGRGYGQHEDTFFPAFETPLSYVSSHDPLTGRTAGLLDRCLATRTCPRIMHVVSSWEYWQGRHSLNQTDALGTQDLRESPFVRMYLLTSTQHQSVPAPAPGTLPPLGICQWPQNPAPQAETYRALLSALTDWVTANVTPPKSAVPTLESGTLVRPDPATFTFPTIPPTTYVPAAPTVAVEWCRRTDPSATSCDNPTHNRLQLLDFGPGFEAEAVSGEVTNNPPSIVPGFEYAVLVPVVNSDGNETSGVRSTEVQVPLGTHTGWSRRRQGRALDQNCRTNGIYIPFALTAAEREAAGDTRLSLEERYGSHDYYVKKVEHAAKKLLKKRFLLPEDAVRLVEEAKSRNLGLPPGPGGPADGADVADDDEARND
jgi:Alpha/beta hydrolase domain